MTARLTILAVVEEAQSTRRCLTAAALAGAVNPNATLTALHVEVDPKRIHTAPEEISIQRLRVPAEGSSRDRAKLVRQMFDFWCAGRGQLPTKWASEVGTVGAVLAAQAEGADLIVLSQPHNMDSFDAFHTALFDARKLVLYVPDSNGIQSVHRRMAIAWKDQRQAVRAIQSSLPWLSAADQVTVIGVQEGVTVPQFDSVRQTLELNQVNAEFRAVRAAGDEHASQCILREARAVRADSLVMGAFRFGIIAEWFFGGVTREILREAALPVFLMH